MAASVTVRFGGNLDDLKKALAEGKVLVENTTSAIDRMASRLKGDAAKREAEKWAAAITQIGGATKLTTKDQERANRVMQEAINYYKVAGQQIPPQIQKIADATKQAAAQTQTLSKTAVQLRNFAGAIGVTFGAAGVLSAVKSALALGDSLDRMSKQTGIGVREIQRLGYAARQSGNDLDQVVTGTSQFLNRLSEGSEDTVAAVNQLGLSVETLLKSSPDEAFLQVSDAIRKVGSSSERTKIAMDLFGKAGAQLLPTLTSDMRALGDEAERTGQVLSELEVKKLDQAGDEIEKLQNRIKVATASGIVAFDAMGESLGRFIWRLENGTWMNRLLAIAQFTPFLNREQRAYIETFGEMHGANEFTDRPGGRPALPAPPAWTTTTAPGLPPINLGWAEWAQGRLDRRTGGATAAGEDWYGLQQIAEAQRLIELVGRASQMSADKQEELRSRLLAGAEAADRLGRMVQAAALRAGAGLVPLSSRTLGVSQLTTLPAGAGAGNMGSFSNLENLPSRSLAGVQWTLPDIKPQLEHVGGQISGWAKSFFSQLPQTIIGALQGGGDLVRSVGALFGSKLGEGLGASVEKWASGLGSKLGKWFGSALGSIIPGLGSLLGSALGWIGDKLFGKSAAWKADRAADQTLDQLRNNLLATYGTLEDIDRIGRQLGVDLAAAWGDRSAAGLAHFQLLLEQFNAELARNKKLQSDLGALAPGQLLPENIARQIAGGGLTDETKQAIGQYMQGQTSYGVSSIQKIAANAPITSAAGAAGIGAGVSGIFAQMQAQGMSGVEIAQQLGPAIDQLKKKFDEAGFSGGAAFDAIAKSMSYLRDETVAPLLEGVSGVTGLMTSLANLGRLDQETFKGLAAEVSATHEKLTKAGKGGKQALDALAPDLQKIWELQQRFGYEVDASTQKLIDQALASGRIGEEFKSPQEQMLTAIDELITRMGEFIDTIMGVPDAATEAGSAIVDKFPHEIGIKIKFNPENIPESWTGGGDGGGFEPPQLAAGGIVTRPTFALIGESGPEAVIPLERVRQSETGSALVPGVPVTLTFNVNAIDRAGVREFIENEALPAITEAVAANTRQARTNLSAALGV